jgi:hypothetical protein
VAKAVDLADSARSCRGQFASHRTKVGLLQSGSATPAFRNAFRPSSSDRYFRWRFGATSTRSASPRSKNNSREVAQ